MMKAFIKPFRKGMIILWSGSVASIPSGWALCNGSNSTPDLRNNFVVGAGDTYAPDDTGGGATHTHTGTTNGHTHTPGASPSGSITTSGINGLTITTDTDTFTTAAGDSLPPYHALCYIMKL